MPLVFYPHLEDAQQGSLEDRIEVLREAAERFRATVLDTAAKIEFRFTTPKDQTISYNWEEIAVVLREVRALPEGNKVDRSRKATLLTKLAEIYEILRGAKMPKLETVRLTLMGEASQLNTV